jgi:hypothetical protein
MDQENQFRSCMRQGFEQSLLLDGERIASVSHLHRNSERVSGLLEIVSEHPVENGKYGILLRRSSNTIARTEETSQLLQGAIDARAYKICDTANASINGRIDGARWALKRMAQYTGSASDRVMHGFDKVTDAQSCLDGETTRASQIIDMRAKALCVHF